MRRIPLFALVLALILGALFFTSPRSGRHEVERVDEIDSTRATITAAVVEAAPSPAATPAAPRVESVEVMAVAEPAAPTQILDRPKETATLYGFVLPLADTPLDASLWVNLTDRQGEKRLEEPGSEGGFSFAGLQAGKYWIEAGSRTEGMTPRVIELDPASGDLRVDLQLESGRDVDLMVEVVDQAGEPVRVPMLIAVATREQPEGWFDEVSSNLNEWKANGVGEASFPAAVLGRLRLKLPAPLFVSLVHWQRVVASQLVEPGQTSVRFVLDKNSSELQPGQLRLRLIDEHTRQPLPGISVGVTFGVGFSGGVTEQDGRFSFSCFPGVVGFRVLGKLHESAELRVRLEPGVEKDLGDIALGPAVFISGKVVDDQGRGIKTRLSYEMLDPISRTPGPRGAIFEIASTDDGSFRVTGLARRVYRLRYRNRNVSGFAPQVMDVDALGGSVEGVTLRLARGTPLILLASDDRWPLVRFDVLDASGMQMISNRPLYGPAPQKILLAPGRYEVEVRIAGALEGYRRPLTIAADPVELLLP